MSMRELDAGSIRDEYFKDDQHLQRMQGVLKRVFADAEVLKEVHKVPFFNQRGRSEDGFRYFGLSSEASGSVSPETIEHTVNFFNRVLKGQPKDGIQGLCKIDDPEHAMEVATQYILRSTDEKQLQTIPIYLLAYPFETELHTVQLLRGKHTKLPPHAKNGEVLILEGFLKGFWSSLTASDRATKETWHDLLYMSLERLAARLLAWPHDNVNLPLQAFSGNNDAIDPLRDFGSALFGVLRAFGQQRAIAAWHLPGELSSDQGRMIQDRTPEIARTLAICSQLLEQLLLDSFLEKAFPGSDPSRDSFAAAVRSLWTINSIQELDHDGQPQPRALWQLPGHASRGVGANPHPIPVNDSSWLLNCFVHPGRAKQQPVDQPTMATIDITFGEQIESFCGHGFRLGLDSTCPCDGKEAEKNVDIEALRRSLGLLNHALRERLTLHIAAQEGVRAETRADLAASFSHGYVKQADVMATLAQEISRLVAKPGPRPAVGTRARRLAVTASDLQVQLDAYRSDMEIFAEVAKGGGFELDSMKLSPDSAEAHVLADRLLVGTIHGLFVGLIHYGYDDGSLKRRFGDMLADVRQIGRVLGLDMDFGTNLTQTTIRQIQKLGRGNLTVSFRPEKVDALRSFRLKRLPVAPSGRNPNRFLKKALEKVFFEVVVNSLRNWSDAFRDGPRVALYGGQVLLPFINFNIRRSADGANVEVITSTAAYYHAPPLARRELNGTEDEFSNFLTSFGIWQQPQRPRTFGGVGGWGLYGNQQFASLLKARGVEVERVGRFETRSDFLTKEPNAPCNFAHKYSTRLSLPSEFFIDPPLCEPEDS